MEDDKLSLMSDEDLQYEIGEAYKKEIELNSLKMKYAEELFKRKKEKSKYYEYIEKFFKKIDRNGYQTITSYYKVIDCTCSDFKGEIISDLIVDMIEIREYKNENYGNSVEVSFESNYISNSQINKLIEITEDEYNKGLYNAIKIIKKHYDSKYIRGKE